MIRFIKYMGGKDLAKFKGEVPAHSCIIEAYETGSSKQYEERTDKVYIYPARLTWTSEFVEDLIEFIMGVHERRGSNTTCFSQDYTVAKFLSEMLEIQKGRFTGESESGKFIQENYDMLSEGYSKYVLEGVVA
jgi:hypothetical protein